MERRTVQSESEQSVRCTLHQMPAVMRVYVAPKLKDEENIFLLLSHFSADNGSLSKQLEDTSAVLTGKQHPHQVSVLKLFRTAV